MQRVAAWTMVVVATLALAACGGSEQPSEDVRPVQTVVAERTPTVEAAVYPGSVAARHVSNQMFRVPGTVEKKLVDTGDHVVAGQALVQLDPTTLQLNQQAARAQLDAARSRAAQAKVNLRRDADLLRQQFISQAEYDHTKVEFDDATSKLQAAQAQYDDASNQLGYGTLRAAVPGYVTAINVDVGQVVNTMTPAVQIAQDGDREVVVSIPEGAVDQFRGAQGLYVTLWTDPDKHYRAHLRMIEPETDPATRTFPAHVTILDPDSAVMLGMTAFVHQPEISAGSKTFSLPITAVLQKAGGSYVWLVDKQADTVREQNVTVLSIQKDTALISAGLKSGDVVVTAGGSFLHPGQKVRPAGVFSSTRQEL